MNKDVDCQKTVGRDVVVSKSHNLNVLVQLIPLTEPTYNEKNSQDDKATKLNSLSPKSINSRNRNPITRNGTCKYNDDVSNSGIVQKLINVVGILGRITNNLENSTVVQRKTIERNIKTEP